MRRVGAVELARRAVVLVLFVVGAVETFEDLRSPSWISGLLWSSLAVAVYLLIPRPTPPTGALRHEALPAIIMPDVLGFLLGVTFFALPFVIVNSDPLLKDVWIIHAVLWLLGAFALAILYIAARHACSWIQLRNDGMIIADLWRVIDLPFLEIERVNAVERRLPRWIGPALVLFGGWRGAGVASLHANRTSHAIEFIHKSGVPISFPIDAFPNLDRVVVALTKAGVSIDAEPAIA